MTWVRIDRESTEAAMNRTIDASRQAIAILDGYRALDTAGLGDLGPATADHIASSWRVMSDAWETYLRESIAVLEKLLQLVGEQQAASVVGMVNSGDSPAAAIIGGTLVGGTVVGAATSTGSGSAIVGGNLVGAATPMGSGPAIVGGTFLGAATPMGSGPAIVGGTPSYADNPLLRAAIAADRRGDTQLASQMAAVSGVIRDSIDDSIALAVAPRGARSMGAYGPSAGYEAFGSHGLEVPIYSR